MNRSFLLGACALLAGGCSLVVSFDPNRIGADSGTMDAGVPDAAARDGATDGAVRPDGAAACALDTHEGCAAGELCCDQGGPSCVATGLSQCEVCGSACPTDGADGCRDRACVCGDGLACAGDTPLCVGGECVQCRDASDCAGQQCVGGRCVQCDPADSAGCSGDTPICGDDMTCRACSMDPDDCPGILMCTASGACGGCDRATHEGCDTPTAPICDAATTVCRRCDTATECEDLDLAFCLGDGRCAACDPSDDSGCGGQTPICAAAEGGFACGPCASDGDCAERGATPVCAETGGQAGACVQCDAEDASLCAAMDGVCDVATNRCVECASDADCEGVTPVCGSDGTCRGCESNPECEAITSGTVCVNAGAADGSCGACDPGAASPTCSGATPICDPATASCVGCTSDPECDALTEGSICLEGSGECALCDPTDNAGCSGQTPICDAGSSCVACTEDGQCASGVCVTAGDEQGACGDCDPADHEPCMGDAPICDSATATCRGCVADDECPEGQACATAGPNAGLCGACDPGEDGGSDCAAPTGVCDPDALTCVQCVDSSTCTDIDSGFECQSNQCVCTGPGGAGQFCDCGAGRCDMGAVCFDGSCM